MSPQIKHKRTEYLKSNKKHAKHGYKIKGRKDLINCGRFLVDNEDMIIHDLAREKDNCELDPLFEQKKAETYTKSLRDAISEGFVTCEECIGTSPKETFEGKNTVLYVMNLPIRSGDPMDGVLERESFKRRLSIIHNNPSDEQSLARILTRHKVGSVFYQASRLRTKKNDPTVWGEPDVVFPFNPNQRPTLSSSDDVLTDMLVPSAILNDENKLQEFAATFTGALLEVHTIRQSFKKHAHRYGYRDLAIYAHICDTVDDWLIHRPSPKCSYDSGGASNTLIQNLYEEQTGGSITPDVSVRVDEHEFSVWIGVKYYK
jgi:hypothetical protein